jgi:bacterioferritin
VSRLKEVRIGADVQNQFKNDWSGEADANRAYNSAIRRAMELGDDGTRELLSSILKDEEEHIDLIEAQLGQIEQMGIQTYLAEQIAEEE